MKTAKHRTSRRLREVREWKNRVDDLGAEMAPRDALRRILEVSAKNAEDYPGPRAVVGYRYPVASTPNVAIASVAEDCPHPPQASEKGSAEGGPDGY